MRKFFEEPQIAMLRLEAMENTTSVDAGDEEPSMGGGSEDDGGWGDW